MIGIMVCANMNSSLHIIQLVSSKYILRITKYKNQSTTIKLKLRQLLHYRGSGKRSWKVAMN